MLLLLAVRASFAQDTFTVAVLPDTQLYSRDHPESYQAMCRWLVDHRDELNLVFVSHVGDIVQDDVAWQWDNAKRAHNILAEAGIPFGMAIGNHDGRNPARHDLQGENFLKYFGPGAMFHSADETRGTFAEQPWYGGASASGLSSYQVITADQAAGASMLFIHLEVGMRKAEVGWAEDVIRSHPKHAVVISTHRYLYDWRTIRGRYGPFHHEHFDPLYQGQAYDADRLFNDVLRKHPNVVMVWCGHNDGELRRADVNDHGVPVHEMLHDYSAFSPNGGGGWLRLYTFDSHAGEVKARTVSGTTGRVRMQEDQVDGLLESLGAFASIAERKTGWRISSLPPAMKSLLVRAFSEPGATSEFVRTMSTGEGGFSWVFPLLDALEGEQGRRVREVVLNFPYRDLSPGLVDLMDREGGAIIEAFLDEDRSAIRRYFTQDDNARLVEAFLADGDRSPGFTLQIDFSPYLVEKGGVENGEPVPASP